MHWAGRKTGLAKPDLPRSLPNNFSMGCRLCALMAGSRTPTQRQPGQSTDCRQPQIDQLHRLCGVGMTVSLAMLVVKGDGKPVEAGAGDRTIGDRHGQLVGLATIAHIG